MSRSVSIEDLYPLGTENRCCFVCEHSTTNPALIARVEGPPYFQPRAFQTSVVECLRFSWGGRLVFGYNVCGEFQER